ncbi:MAG: HPr family phosphocarrier protein [Lachnospiraceae bacterium]|nr:HPr family phosphocarrier protein [Lachnospiraceae bacterium]
MERKLFLKPSMVKDFVNAASKCDFDIDVASNYRYYVDAKSILGILALDLSKPIKITYSGYNPDFEAYLRTAEQAV